MESIIAELLELALAWTGYEPPALAPPVEVLQAAAMPCPCPGFFGYARQEPGYGAMLDFPARLLLRSDVDTGTAMGRSILLHELVHALQSQSGPAAFGSAEWNRREREAYRVQYRYLRMSHVHIPKEWRVTARED